MKVDFYTSKREYHEKKAEFQTAINNVIEKGNFILGEEVKDLERQIQEYTGAKYAIGVASGSDALVIASDILGFKDGNEVITSPFTFLASASCIARLKGKPVYFTVDLDVLDAAVFPGTGTPEAGGVSFDELRRAMNLVANKCNVVGCDMVELSPPYDQSGISTATALKLLREYLLALDYNINNK